MRIAPLLLISCVAGCAAPPKSPTVQIEPEQYPVALKAGVEVLRSAGYTPAFVDPFGGVIESAPRHVGGLLEPWRLDSRNGAQVLAFTGANHRRRVRLEFIPSESEVASLPETDRLEGPPLAGSEGDLAVRSVAESVGSIEVRAWVSLERAVVPGTRLSTDSGRLASRWTDPSYGRADEGDDETRAYLAQWAPIGRDQDYEAWILRRFLEQLARSPGDPGASEPETGATPPGAP